MNLKPLLSTCLAVSLLATPALAQRRGGSFDDAAPPPPNTTYQGPQGFSFQGDQLPPSHDRPYVGQYNDRYSETYRQQQAQAQATPGGGCLRYGALGAAGGHLAGHGVLGALAGCAVGHVVRKRDQDRLRAQQQDEAPR